MKQGWEKLPFEDSIVKVKYTTKIPSNDYLEQGLYPIVSQEEGLISGYWDNANDVFKVSTPVVIFGDHTRILKYVDFDFVLGADGVKILQPIKSIDAKFFKLHLESCKIPSLGYSRHYKLLKELQVPVPPREEQERIVEELDCLSGVIEKKREQLKQLDALAQSIFYQMFGDPITNEKGWEVKKVKDIFSVKIGPFGSLLHNSDYISGGTPLVNPIHMHNERICPDYDFSVSDNKLKELGNYILHTDDIVLARRGDIGRCAIVGMNEDGYLCGTGSLFIRPITNINSNFIIKQIRCNTMIEHLTSLAKGATMLNINCKIVEELIIILPPLTLQQEFADKIEAIEKQKELIKKSISETENLFNARMDYYFN